MRSIPEAMSAQSAQKCRAAVGIHVRPFVQLAAGLGLILSVAGFCRQAVRLTEKHKVRRFFSMAFASVVLVAAIGALVGEAYLYSRDPGFAGKAGLWVWQKVTGQEALPGSGTGDVAQVDENGMPLEAVPDEYYTTGANREGDVPTGDGR
jgi:hypothetical protein